MEKCRLISCTLAFLNKKQNIKFKIISFANYIPVKTDSAETNNFYFPKLIINFKYF